MSDYYDIKKEYGSQVFGDAVMKERLPDEVYTSLANSIKGLGGLDPGFADIVADAMKDWAIEKGATHYTHWFQPMTGNTAEKHESFLDFDERRELILKFSGSELISGESDASSFPTGGMRETWEARGYTAWDPTSPAFVKGNVLYIPTAFCSYSGEALDKKTPLLRSMQALNKQGKRILKLFGAPDDTAIVTNCGVEQEYFLIDESLYDARPDLIYTGRTLFGSAPPKGQDLDDHYFGVIKPRVAGFMQDLDENLWSLGIASRIRHNEVAPSQHELAPAYETANRASDHNQLIMETLKSIAPKHGLVCLTHEKPFAGVNGSGKHCNWSLSTSGGENLFDPGTTPSENARFLLFLSAVIRAVDLHQDLLRVSVSSAANDHRFGKDEAPPMIVSIFLGEELTDILETIKLGGEARSKERISMNIGVDVLPWFPKDTTDRNRTSPFAFTGNKFEFRMVGSSQSIAGPVYVLNTIVADVLAGFADRLEKAPDLNAEIAGIVKEVVLGHERIIFNGNSYSKEWEAEAERRGLLNIATTTEALPFLNTPENVALLARHEVLTPEEVESRLELQLEAYVKVIRIEALTMLELAHRDIVPAVVSYQAEVLETANAKTEYADRQKLSTALESALLKKLSALGEALSENMLALERALADEPESETLELAGYFGTVVIAAMAELRETVDSLENIVGRDYWPLPGYGEILYSVK